MSKEFIQPKITFFLSKPNFTEKKPEETSLKRKLSDSTAEGDMANQDNGCKKSYAGAVSCDHSSGASRRNSSLQNNDHQNNNKQDKHNTDRTEWAPLAGQKQLSSESDRNKYDSNPGTGIQDKKFNAGGTGGEALAGHKKLSSGSDRESCDSDSSPGIQENADSSHTPEDSFHQVQGAKQGCSKEDDDEYVHITENKSAVPYNNITFWRGVNIEELKRAPACFKKNGMSLPPLKASSDHKVFFDIPDEGWNGRIPTPHHGKSYWDDDHVYMPYNAKNEMPENGRICSRWEKIELTLTGKISDSFDLAAAILKYNPHYKNRWNFDSLNNFFEANEDLQIEFFTKILPEMQALALRLPELCPMAIPILKQGRNMKLTFSQQQVACLLANAFFCTFPKRNFKSKHCRLPDINFSNLYTESNDSCRAEKLNCIINYFRRVIKDMPKGTVTYARQHVVGDADWPDLHKKFSRLHVSTTGTIEDDGWGMLQADFANKYVGGGVLGHGLVQEEIRFVICPEMVLSRLFTEVLGDKEVLIMTGCERFSKYTGYSRTFKYSGNYVDNTERDEWGRRYTEVVAMDALVFREFASQYEKDKIFRELNKAYCAFTGNQFTRHLPAVCTGNWGCGAFGGDKQLKAMIQWIAASAVDRDVCYLTFGDAKLCDQLGQLYSLFIDSGVQISNVMGFIKRYCAQLKNPYAEQQSLFQCIASMVGGKLEEPYIPQKISNQNKVNPGNSWKDMNDQ